MEEAQKENCIGHRCFGKWDEAVEDHLPNHRMKVLISNMQIAATGVLKNDGDNSHMSINIEKFEQLITETRDALPGKFLFCEKHRPPYQYHQDLVVIMVAKKHWKATPHSWVYLSSLFILNGDQVTHCMASHIPRARLMDGLAKTCPVQAGPGPAHQRARFGQARLADYGQNDEP
ncbi:hypothetical protein QJS04_geneDACA017630 [Acorus gramineus]|uniref:Uncharacterized protein n=1 Tax=Acorus gramineus TaxID=55184 RepID=A0AAV9AWC1_ACOGR|nr:hypothetical protein QJS04_geneDACA017630 [Acorus gramineus]